MTKINNDIDILYMRRCIQLALNAEGRTYPNPMVGAVVVCDGRIIGEGWHHKAGEPHAEVNAIKSIKNKQMLRRSTIYVSLEPCAHTGRTPPCADLIIKSRIPRVVIGCRDSFAAVNGKGIEKLRAAGVAVKVGVLENECRWLNRRFFTVHERHRPYVILKWAQTVNGMMGRRDEEGKALPADISDATCLRNAHKQRTTEDGILVGSGTVESDNPRLSARLWSGPQPTRYVLSSHHKLGTGYNIFDGSQRTVVIAGQSVGDVLAQVYAEGTQSVVVEGGAYTLSRFIDSGLWDEAFVYVADFEIGDGVAAPVLDGGLESVENIGNCRLYHYVSVDHITR